MNPTASLSLSTLLTISILVLPASAFNVTKLFGRHPEFSTFNDYLTQTDLASQINSRQTITILAVENSAVSSLSGRSLDVVKKILSMHVVLDYYDAQKLNNLSKRSAMLTTMFQSTGVAENQQGFLNVTVMKSGEVMFGSAVKGSGLTAKLIKSVAAQPYNISVLQIDSVLIAPGIDVVNTNHSTPPPPPPPAKATAPTPSSDDADAPSSDDDIADAPVEADAPAVADAPAEDDAPASSPPEPDTVADEDDKAEAPSPSSDGARVGFGYGIGVVMGLGVFGFVGL